MPRTQRKESASGVYHVTMRGNGRQLLFENDRDRHTFVDLLKEAKLNNEIKIVAWCLMDNHVHVLVRCSLPTLSTSMGSVASSYAAYFNKKDEHVGHVFQGRFASVPVESDAHLLDAVRYIHDNPVKAGISSAETYYWSSCGEYLGANRGLADTSLVLGMLGGKDGFVAFSKTHGNPPAVYENRRLSDEEIEEVARASLPEGMRLEDVKTLAKKRRNAQLSAMHVNGLSIRQIERLTGIGRRAIERAIK